MKPTCLLANAISLRSTALTARVTSTLSSSVCIELHLRGACRVSRAPRVEQASGRHDTEAMAAFKAARSAAAERSIQKRNTPLVVVEALLMLKTTASWNS